MSAPAPAAQPVAAPSRPGVRVLHDAAAMLCLAALAGLALWPALRGGTVVAQDTAAFHLPMLSHLGERLRAGDIPGWSPHQFSGAPFAADPQSGWMYLPAMLLFTLLPLEGATEGYLLLHLLGAGLAVYALARAIGMSPLGALTAGIAHELSGYAFGRGLCCFAFSALHLWIPVLLLGAEMAVRAAGGVPAWGGRVGNPPLRTASAWLAAAPWWGLGGLALSQALAGWLGQGSYYALLALGGYLAYRTLLAPPPGMGGVFGRAGAPLVLQRVPSLGLHGQPGVAVLPGRGTFSAGRWGAALVALAVHGGAITLFALGLSAAGLLPRLEYNALSSLAGGYSPAQLTADLGWSVRDWANVLRPGLWYAGGVALALAVLAPFLAGRRHATPFWAALAVGALVLSGRVPTPLHAVLYLLPGFERLHPHGPARAMMLFFPAVALLSGASVSGLWGRRDGRRPLLPLQRGARLLSRVAPATPRRARPAARERVPGAATGPSFAPFVALGALCLLAPLPGGYAHRGAMLGAVLAAGAAALLPGGRRLAALLPLLLAADLLAADRAILRGGLGAGVPLRLERVDLATYYAPSGAGAYLARQQGRPSRYFGYGPSDRYVGYTGTGENERTPYTLRYADPVVRALAVNNRATVLGLQDVQGYNPVHLARYDELITHLNGRAQGYHDAEVLERGLGSPLLDLLGARHIVVPAHAAPHQADLKLLDKLYPTAYEDARVKVLENRKALPRAWLVHAARRVGRGEALELLSSGAADPRRTALLEQPPPPLAPPADPESDRIRLVEYAPDRVRLSSRSAAAGLLVLADPHYPAWKAYVDGSPAPLYIADHAFRAVPAGAHEIEMRYESRALQLGLAISAGSYATLAALALARVVRRLSRLRGDVQPAYSGGRGE